LAAGEFLNGLVQMVNGPENWKLSIFRDASAASEAAADRVAATIANDSDAAIALPTGSTPLIMFDILAARAARGEVDFSGVHLFCLDEYVGVTPHDQVSLTRWLRDAFLQRVGLQDDQVHPLPSTADDLVAAASEFDQAIAARGGLNLAVLGLGPNGHIGYNEPGSSADSRTRVVTLTPESRSQATAYWDGAAQIPDRAMTMGVGTLLEAKQIVLLVTGEAKAEMLRRTLAEPMSADVPASWLRLAGPRLTIIADEAAASELSTVPSSSPAGVDDSGEDSNAGRS
jgi:glucosamine-6-phosphate deaminase